MEKHKVIKAMPLAGYMNVMVSDRCKDLTIGSVVKDGDGNAYTVLGIGMPSGVGLHGTNDVTDILVNSSSYSSDVIVF